MKAPNIAKVIQRATCRTRRPERSGGRAPTGAKLCARSKGAPEERGARPKGASARRGRAVGAGLRTSVAKDASERPKGESKPQSGGLRLKPRAHAPTGANIPQQK